jgi:hypothetical protein
MSRHTPGISIDSINNFSNRLVIHAWAAAYTQKNIMSAFQATGIWPLNIHQAFERQSQNCTRPDTPPCSPIPAQTKTPRKPRAISRLVRDALHLVTPQTPSSLKLKSLIGQLGTSAQGALADKELGEEMVRFRCSRDKHPTAVAAKDRLHFSKARECTAEDVVQLREEKETIDQEKAAKIKMRQDKAAANAAPVGKGLKGSKHAEKQGVDSKKVDTNCISDWEDEEEDITDGGWWDDENAEGEEGSVIYV